MVYGIAIPTLFAVTFSFPQIFSRETCANDLSSHPGSAFAVTRMACTLSRPTRPSSWPRPEAATVQGTV